MLRTWAMPRQTDTSPVSFQYMYASDDFVPAPSACMMLQYSACTKARNFQQSPTGWHSQLPTRVDVHGMQAVRDEHKQEFRRYVFFVPTLTTTSIFARQQFKADLNMRRSTCT